MYRVLIWGTGGEYSRHFNCIKFLEYKKEISVIGVITKDKDITVSIDNYPVIDRKGVSMIEYDFCLVAMPNLGKIVCEAEMLGIDKSKLILLNVLSIPNFNFKEYIRLKESSLSIFAPLCWAGFCYHRLGLEFLSPTINMYEDADDFNKLMMNLDTYLSYDVEYAETGYDVNLKSEFPIGIVGDVKLFFNHYKTFEDAKSCWERRKERVNRDNILVVSYSDCKKTLYDFENVPYKNKIIFTSNHIDTPSACFINPNENGELWKSVNNTATGLNNMLDMIPFLNHCADYLCIR